ncbi:ABC transporter substrate-binding protein, partial [uncultured Thiohalocapsa sp.]|uniref:ABC transporter substrate-binding protein n=1 Tax=uncultured Thiohalocapsa sp. TaxID=768990 RepID=UPI0025DFE8A8
ATTTFLNAPPDGAVAGEARSCFRAGYPTRLVFRLKAGDSDWRVYDVVAEGRSMLAFYRAAFERLMEAAPRD